MRIVLAIIGAILGFTLESGARELLGVLLGAAVGFALAELFELGGRLDALEEQVKALRTSLARQKSPEAVSPSVKNSNTAGPGATGTEAAGAEVAGTSARDADAMRPVVPASAPLTIGEARATLEDIGWARSAQSRSSGSAKVAQEPGSAKAAQDSGAAKAARPSSSSRISASAPPDFFDTIVGALRDYFTGGNTLVRTGIIILFFGVAFLLRYAAEHTHVPIEIRLSGVALGGIVLLVLGWRLRRSRPGYALALQGGAVGILYLTVFAALRIYALLPPAAAFALLAVLAGFCAALAVLQNSQAFALLAATGGFLAPVLASTGQGSHVVLFSYYAVLNAGILAIAWFKAWRALNVAGFLFTFVIGTAWGVLKYQSVLFASTEPFLILFFLFYVLIVILFASRQPPELRGYVDGTLVFGTPIVAFGLQSGMLHERPFALAYSALAVSALYLSLAWLLHRRGRESMRLLVESFMALGVLFLTLAVPLALDGRWSAATWALEGAALVWIGCRQSRRLPRAFGALLQIAGGVIFASDLAAPYGGFPVLNSACLGGVMVSAGSVFSAAVLERYRERLSDYEAPVGWILFFWGLVWWLYTGLSEIQRHVPQPYETAAASLFATVTALVSSELHQRAKLRLARLPALFLLPAMVLFACIAVFGAHHPFAQGGWVAWPSAFAAFYFLCRRHEGEPGAVLANTLHVAGTWLLIGLVSWEVAWDINEGVAGAGSWPAIAWALIPAIALFALPRLVTRIEWPIAVHSRAYVELAGSGIALFLALWSLVTNFMLRGDPYPLPYVPLLNPLDLAQAFVLLVLLRFGLQARAARYRLFADIGDVPLAAGLAGLAFVWLNAVLLRTLHYWAGVAFPIETMLQSTLVQTSLSIFWAVLALTTMLLATRRGSRGVWLTGAGLLVIVIAKLFLVDLSRIGTIERIVSFVGVGVLMLVIGYFSPLPPPVGREQVAK